MAKKSLNLGFNAKKIVLRKKCILTYPMQLGVLWRTSVETITPGLFWVFLGKFSKCRFCPILLLKRHRTISSLVPTDAKGSLLYAHGSFIVLRILAIEKMAKKSLNLGFFAKKIVLRKKCILTYPMQLGVLGRTSVEPITPVPSRRFSMIFRLARFFKHRKREDSDFCLF